MRRRSVLQWLAGGAAGAMVPRTFAEAQGRAEPQQSRTRKLPPLRGADEAFLDELERRGCLYFIEQADPASGQVQDRAAAAGLNGALDPRKLSSIAATGFGLTALCIAHHRGYLPAAAVEERVQRTLAFHARTLPQEHGFFCHFNDVRTGEPIAKVEYSSIDTSLLLCGVLTARAYFANNAAIARDATLIYERVDWPWMLSGSSDLFSMGWHPNSGFLKSTWNHYCELMMIPLLAMGSPTHPVSPKVWGAWSRPVIEYKGLHYIGADDPIFVHQYSHAWFDFRGRHDAFADYFQNSVVATEAHRLFCLNWGKPYSPDYWGISASDSQAGVPCLGRPAGVWRRGRDGGAVRRRRLAAVSASRVPRDPSRAEGGLWRQGVGPLRLLRRLSPGGALV